MIKTEKEYLKEINILLSEVKPDLIYVLEHLFLLSEGSEQAFLSKIGSVNSEAFKKMKKLKALLREYSGKKREI